MDTSNKYIEMCKLAIQIQGIKVPMWGYCNFAMGDVFYKGGLFNKVSVFIKLLEDQGQPNTTDAVWLPRQDQLQSMLYSKSFMSQFKKLSKFIELNSIRGGKDTWEQLWLKVVMKENYRKEWINGQWYKI
jgi:hypothetical protein